jgi:hypothetical protein
VGTTEVPKVTESTRRGQLLPLSGGADQAVGNQAEPEVHDGTQVDVETMVLGYGGQGGHEEEIRYVSQDNRQKRLQKIDEH